MKEKIKAFFKSTVGKWVLGLIIIAFGGSVIWGLIPTDSVVDAVLDDLIPIDTITDLIPEDITELGGSIIDGIFD